VYVQGYIAQTETVCHQRPRLAVLLVVDQHEDNVIVPLYWLGHLSINVAMNSFTKVIEGSVSGKKTD